MSAFPSTALLTGRILLSLIFLVSGLMKLFAWQTTAGYMESKGMPAVPVLLTGAVLVELAGGLCLLFGFQVRLAALILILYLIPATLIFHNFWTLEGQEQQNQLHHFLKNLAIMGGLLSLAAAGAGVYALDAPRASSTPAGVNPP